MPVKQQLIEQTWRALQPFVRETKCAGCECLQGALTELRFALDEHPPDPECDALCVAISQAMRVSERHACLGCDPCVPSALLAAVYRGQAHEASLPTACCDT